MKILKRFLAGLICTGLFSCSNAITPVIQPDLANKDIESISSQQKSFQNKYICITMANGGSDLVKVINLQTKEVIALPVAGFVQGMSADLEQNAIYVNAKGSGGDYSLFKLDIKAKKIDRILSFSQLGIKPTYFVVNKNNVFVTGKRGDSGVFYGNDLIKNEWFSVASNISIGRIELGFTEDTYHVISFDEQYVTKTVVDVKLKQIISRKTITHDIPFGNNVFIPSPHGLFVFVLHQLQNSFIPFVFNVKQGTVSKFDEVKTNDGLLYSAIVSNDGKQLLTNVNREIYHYKLENEKLIQLPKVSLNIPESRNMVMGGDNRTLYITHDSGQNMSIVTFSQDLTTYTISTMYLGGPSNQVYLF
jgi:hypothetical protein